MYTNILPAVYDRQLESGFRQEAEYKRYTV